MGLDPQVCAIAQSEVGWRRAGRGPPPVMVPCRPAAERRCRTGEVEESQDAGAGSGLASMPRREEVRGARRETGRSFRRGRRLAGRKGEKFRFNRTCCFSWPVAPRHRYDVTGWAKRVAEVLQTDLFLKPAGSS